MKKHFYYKLPSELQNDIDLIIKKYNQEYFYKRITYDIIMYYLNKTKPFMNSSYYPVTELEIFLLCAAIRKIKKTRHSIKYTDLINERFN